MPLGAGKENPVKQGENNMARGIPKKRKGRGMLAWRSRQKRGAIMKASTFKKIQRRGARRYGAKRGKKIAGVAYWKTVRAKYRKR